MLVEREHTIINATKTKTQPLVVEDEEFFLQFARKIEKRKRERQVYMYIIRERERRRTTYAYRWRV